MLTIIFATICAYLIGSLSSAVLICKFYGIADPRTSGSNNPGATNVLRVGGKLAAILTLFGDLGKGMLAVLIAKALNFTDIGLTLVMIAVFLGHLYPIFFNFQGGKGVATALGVFLAFSWPFAAMLMGVWLIIVFISRISSLGAIIAAIVALCSTWFFFASIYSSAVAFIAGLLLLRHKQNIFRLLHGQESKIGCKA